MNATPTTAAANGPLWGARARDWADIQEPLVRPVYDVVFQYASLDSSTTYLDVGCGAGLAAELARARGATVTGLDASEALLAIARERVPSGSFHHGDLEALPFAGAAFDLVTGFNAFQYAGDPVAALAEARRVAKRTSPVVIVTWGDPEGMDAAKLVAAIKPLSPAPPPGTPGPFALSDEAVLRAFARQAGLEPTEVIDVPCLWSYPDLPTALRGLNASGVAVRAIRHSSENAVSHAHAAALKPFRQTNGSYLIGATFRCLFSRA